MKKILSVVFCILLSGNAMSDSFRCGQALVKVGDSSNALLKKCGNPIRKYVTNIQVYEGGRQYNTSVTNWVYERRGKKDMLVSVQSGGIIKIETD